eukprot:UN26109
MKMKIMKKKNIDSNTPLLVSPMNSPQHTPMKEYSQTPPPSMDKGHLRNQPKRQYKNSLSNLSISHSEDRPMLIKKRSVSECSLQPSVSYSDFTKKAFRK